MMQSRLGASSLQRIFGGTFAVMTAGITLLAAESVAHADERAVCATAADQGQQLRDEGKYRRARVELLLCARDVCPAPIKRDCLEWLEQLERTAPTVVFGAKAGGKDLSDVKVSVDGAVVTERLDGKPLQMDLGKHTVRFEYHGQTKQEDVIIGAGQKNRSVAATFSTGTANAAPAGPAAPSTTEGHRGSLVPAFIVGGLGVLALGSFAFFGLGGRSDADDLQACKPRCAESDVDKARTKLIIADISLGVGIVALGVATYMILTRPNLDSHLKTAHASPSNRHPGAPARKGTSNVIFDFGAITGGAMGSVGARF